MASIDDLIWTEMAEQLGLDQDVAAYMIARERTEAEKSAAQSTQRAGSAKEALSHAIAIVKIGMRDVPSVLIERSIATEMALDRFMSTAIHGMPREALVGFFEDDQYTSGELRQTLLTPEDGKVKIPRQFEFAMMQASNTAKPLLSQDVYKDNVSLRLLDTVARHTSDGLFKNDYEDGPFITLDHMKRLHKALGIQAKALESRHKGFAALIGAGSVRAKALFDQIISDARAEMTQAPTPAQYSKARPS